jgi:hypothetical protein
MFCRNAAARRCGQQQQSSHHQDNFRKIQGSMTEDEALAKAIYESMVENQQQQITVGASSSSTSNDRNNKNCSIS